jgi:uncharacterized damage-inducible protein DinB
MSLPSLYRRFSYHAWAAAALAAALTDEDRHAPARRYLAHVFTSDQVWLRRLTGESTDDLVLWPEIGAEACRALARENAAAYPALLAGLTDEDLERNVVYRTMTGVRHETAATDILDHVLLHGAYHRGQAAAALRAAGDTPPATDYIVWVRGAGA